MAVGAITVAIPITLVAPGLGEGGAVTVGVADAPRTI